MINILNESIVELLKKIEALSNRVVVLEEAVLAQQFEINSLSSGMARLDRTPTMLDDPWYTKGR